MGKVFGSSGKRSNPIGVISIVFGVLGGLSNAIQVLSPLFMGAIQAGMPPQVQAQMEAQNAATRQWLPVTISIANETLEIWRAPRR